MKKWEKTICRHMWRKGEKHAKRVERKDTHERREDDLYHSLTYAYIWWIFPFHVHHLWDFSFSSEVQNLSRAPPRGGGEFLVFGEIFGTSLRKVVFCCFFSGEIFSQISPGGRTGHFSGRLCTSAFRFHHLWDFPIYIYIVVQLLQRGNTQK